MIEKLRRTKKICIAIGVIAVILLLIAATSPSKDISDIALLLLLVVVLTAGIVDTKLNSKINRLLKEENDKKPIIATTAVVVSSRVWHKYTSTGSRNGLVRTTPYWYVTFRTLKHGDVELNVPHDVYMAVQTQKRGNLRYQGWKFISFR